MKAPPILPQRRTGIVQPPLEDLDISSCPDSPTDSVSLSGDSHGPAISDLTVANGFNGDDPLNEIKLLSVSDHVNDTHSELQQENAHHNESAMNDTHNHEAEQVNHNNSVPTQISGSNNEPIQISGSSREPTQISGSSGEPAHINGFQLDNGSQMNGVPESEQNHVNVNRSVSEPHGFNNTRSIFPFTKPASDAPYRKVSADTPFIFPEPGRNSAKSVFPFTMSSSDAPYRKVSADTPFIFPEPRRIQFEPTSSSTRSEYAGSPFHPIEPTTNPPGPQIRGFRPGVGRVWSVLTEKEEDEENGEEAGDGGVSDPAAEDEMEKMSRTRGDKSPLVHNSFVRQHLVHVENRLFEMFGDKDKQTININKFLAGLTATGMRHSDPRLRETRQNLKKLQDRLGSTDLQGIEVDYETFMTIISDNLEVLVKAFSCSFIIPDFRGFSDHLDEIYNICRSNNHGKPASYIPQLARSKPEHWAMSVCTVDGQRYSLGDVNIPFTLQSCSKPLTYAMALGLNGTDTMHKFIGMEPSGRYFNELCLDYDNKPHNPMINAGAIMTTALIKPELSAADRFDFVFNMYKRLAGDEFLGFNNAVFLSEKECADRNFALAYFMRENKCFPAGTRLHETLDFYFQLCSLEITAESGAVMAATLANGGVNPLTGDPVLTVDAVRNTLTLMHSCGMYNYSGQFAFKVGLPSKSGVSGCVLLVVPNTVGICLWSPPLDINGNSCRAVQFCMELVSRFNFHNFDNLRGHYTNKIDPRTVRAESTAQILFDLLFSAAAGDLSALRRHSLSGTDMQARDYDGRTALHVASSEGHADIVEYLLRNCQVHPLPKDRWDRTPLDDAVSFNQPLCAALIRESCKKRGIEVPHGPADSTSSTTELKCDYDGYFQNN